jgi:UDP-N-acetyl-2-amino-2-deoxyglucuronate dehydrogenase
MVIIIFIPSFNSVGMKNLIFPMNLSDIPLRYTYNSDSHRIHMKAVKTGIVGCGKVGHLHAKALQRLENSIFTAVCGRDAGRTAAFAAEYGVAAYMDVGEMIEKSGVEAVSICTPHPLHRIPAVAAASAGVHILIEKPLASSLEDCDAILAAADKTGVKTGTVCQRRFYEPVQRVKNAIVQGRIGTPILGTVSMLGWRDKPYYESDGWRGTWKGEGGGVLVNQAPHQLDLLQWYLGPIKELTGYWGNQNHPYIEVEDTAVAILRFENGAIGNICVSNSQNPALYGNIHMHGENGASVGVQTDGGAMFIAGMSSILEPPKLDMWTVPGESELLDTWNAEDAAVFVSAEPMERYHQLQISDFLDAVIYDREPLITGRDGRLTVEMFTAIYRSARDNKPVRFPLKAESGRSDYDGRTGS